MTTTVAPTSASPAGPGLLRLSALHTRLLVLETVRVPIAIIGTIAFPLLSFLFFVAPQDFASDPLAATGATAQLSLFAVASVCLFQFGAGIAEDRALPWDGYLRTLPAGPAPRLLSRLATGLLLAACGVVPLIAAAGLLTAASIEPWRLPLGALALAAAGVPMLGLGLTIGYLLSSKAAIAVAQVLLFPLAFGGGLFLPPSTFPGWLDAISLALPTRAGRDLVVQATTGETMPATTVPVLLGWCALTLATAAWAYRRDEGRRFR